MKGKHHPPTVDPTPEEIRQRAAEIRAGWDENRWAREAWRQGLRSIEVRTPEATNKDYLGEE
jgi:hypothetical protein